MYIVKYCIILQMKTPQLLVRSVVNFLKHTMECYLSAPCPDHETCGRERCLENPTKKEVSNREDTMTLLVEGYMKDAVEQTYILESSIPGQMSVDLAGLLHVDPHKIFNMRRNEVVFILIEESIVKVKLDMSRPFTTIFCNNLPHIYAVAEDFTLARHELVTDFVRSSLEYVKKTRDTRTLLKLLEHSDGDAHLLNAHIVEPTMSRAAKRIKLAERWKANPKEANPAPSVPSTSAEMGPPAANVNSHKNTETMPEQPCKSPSYQPVAEAPESSAPQPSGSQNPDSSRSSSPEHLPPAPPSPSYLPTSPCYRGYSPVRALGREIKQEPEDRS